MCVCVCMYMYTYNTARYVYKCIITTYFAITP